MNNKEKRYALDMTEDVAQEIERLSSELGISKGETLNRGFALLRRTVNAKKEGYHMGLAKDPEKLDKELIVEY